MMENIFDFAEENIRWINSLYVESNKRKIIDGKSIIVVWLTKFCNARCTHCFSRSNMTKLSDIDEMYHLSDEGIEKMISFINKANVSYLLVSGGGEPMYQRASVNRIIRRAQANKIVIATNGEWGASKIKAQEVINELYASYLSRHDDISVTIRLSVDKYHLQTICIEAIINIIEIFRENYAEVNRFSLMIHTLQGDLSIYEITKRLKGSVFNLSDDKNISDSEEIEKVIPQHGFLIINTYKIMVGCARLFYPDLFVNIDDNLNINNKAIRVFDLDMAESERGNPSNVRNFDGRIGLDFWINYNGNVTTWGNQLSDTLYNIYTDDFSKILDGTFNNIYSYSFVDKGYYYRENIINEINEKAVLRTKLINLRNYASQIMLAEQKSKLYLGIIIIQDYLREGVLAHEQIQKFPYLLKKAIASKRQDLIYQYHKSNNSIIKQYLRNKNVKGKVDFELLFILLYYKQFDYNENELRLLFKYYNSQYNQNIHRLSDYISVMKNEYNFMYETAIERLFPMKSQALSYLERKKLV